MTRSRSHTRFALARVRSHAIGFPFIALLGLGAALGSSFDLRAAAAATPDNVVTMTDKPAAFDKPIITIKVGQTVEWKNTGEEIHSVTAVPKDAVKPGDVALPPGAQPFDSGFMGPGATFSYTFTLPGTYKYICLPHEKDGMIGEVIVKK